MSEIRPIRTEMDYQAAIAQIDRLMDALPDTAEGDDLDVLTDLVELYEAKHVPMGHPSPLGAIKFRMEQAGLTARNLVPIIGSRAKVSEVLSGKRDLTLKMARALHMNLGIPAEVLLQQPGASLPNSMADIEWERFPIKQMAKIGWIPNASNLLDRAEEIIRDLISRAGGEDALPALYRKSDHTRANAKTDPYALKAWCWQVLAAARATRLPTPYQPGTISVVFLRKLAKLSWSDDGPKLAKEFLAKHGIHLIVLPHLPRTHLDGAAFRLKDGTPVVALTLRCDRLDNFWFCVLHELAHVGRHMEGNNASSFIDDLTLRDVEGGRDDVQEREADEWAEEALIPNDVWQSSEVRRTATPDSVLSLAKALEIHPAIIAGRVRHERRNFHLLTYYVGSGQVRRLFSGEAT